MISLDLRILKHTHVLLGANPVAKFANMRGDPDYRVNVFLGPRFRFSRLENTIASSNPTPAPNTAPEIVKLRGK
jgi:hypothetical protein